MRILIVDPGFEYSTLAVAESYYDSFKELGYEVMEYDLLKSLRISRNGMNIVCKEEINQSYISEMASAPIISQCLVDKIDVAIFIHGVFVNPAILVSLRKIDVKTALILTDEPMQVDLSEQYSLFYDYVFANEKNTVERHKNCYYLPVAVNHRIFKPQEVEDKYKSEILFAGSFYRERIDFINNLKDILLDYDIKFVGAKKISFPDPILEKYCVANKINYEEMAKYTAGAKISVDIPKNEFSPGPFGLTNKKLVKATYLNPRIFECAASKTLCLTADNRTEVNELFPSGLISTYEYDNSLDFIQVLDVYMENENIRKQKVEEIYKYCLEHHTYDCRAKQIQRIMNLIPSKKLDNYSTVLNNKIADTWCEDWDKNYNYFKSHGLYNSVEKAQEKMKEYDELTIVANGPSMHDNLSCLYKEKNYILGLNETVKIISQDNVSIIDGCCVIHPHIDVFERCIDGVIVNGVDLFCSTVVNKEVVEYWKEFPDNVENRIFFFNTNREGLKKKIIQETGFPVIESGLTVANAAVNLGIYFGFKKITLVGIDCCYLYGKKYLGVDLKFNDKYNDNLFTVPNVFGDTVLTNDVMFRTRNSILNIIKKNSDVDFTVYGRGTVYNSEIPNLRNITQ